MNVMVIGGGGREHAIIQKLRENAEVTKIYALPGNGGTADIAENVPIGTKELEKMTAFAVEKNIDYAVVACDDPLVLGAVDRLEEAGIPAFGPKKDAAAIEGSKVFAKKLMAKYGIPTAVSETFYDEDQALRYLSDAAYPIVIKADGLALGKGVTIANDYEEAKGAVIRIMEEKVFGDSGNAIVIEEFLTGEEVSVLAFTDADTLIPMVSSMDHKQQGEGDTGPNTGGMGTIAPNPFYTKDIAEECMRTIFLPTIKALKAEGRPFRGCLYFGLMLTKEGPKVIEYNCRFGDPETQVILPLLKTDLLTIMRACTEGRLEDVALHFSDESACCVVMASEGYPIKYETGFPITLPENLSEDEHIFIAGAKKDGDILVTSGGRVLGAVCKKRELSQAIAGAYQLVERIHFDHAYYRRDIGNRKGGLHGTSHIC